jgi:hypothetical protein
MATRASNGEVEGPHRSARSELRVHTAFSHPQRYYRPSRTPPTIVRRQHVHLPQPRFINVDKNPRPHTTPTTPEMIKPTRKDRQPVGTHDSVRSPLARKRASPKPNSVSIRAAIMPREIVRQPFGTCGIEIVRSQLPSNGEVEGPHRSARSEPRVHAVFQHPRRHYRRSRTPPTIVRGQLHGVSRKCPASSESSSGTGPSSGRRGV